MLFKGIHVFKSTYIQYVEDLIIVIEHKVNLLKILKYKNNIEV